MAHPFLLLADIGVQIGERLRAELVQADRQVLPFRGQRVGPLEGARAPDDVAEHRKGPQAVGAELVQQDRYLRGLSEAPYFAVKASGATQRVRYHVRGLFQIRPS